MYRLKSKTIRRLVASPTWNASSRSSPYRHSLHMSVKSKYRVSGLCGAGPITSSAIVSLFLIILNLRWPMSLP